MDSFAHLYKIHLFVQKCYNKHVHVNVLSSIDLIC
jgi:hypothetical protein